MKRYIFCSLFPVLCFLFSVTVPCAAQQTLNIHTTTQGVVSFTFAEKPQVTFPEPEVMRVVGTEMTVEFPFSEIGHISFRDDDATAVQTIVVRDNVERVLIYDISGKLLRSTTAQDGAASVDLSPLPAGVYIVKDGKRTYKVKKQ